MPPPAPRFYHVCLATRDVARSIAFWTGAFGFTPYRTIGAGGRFADLKIKGAGASARQPVEFLRSGELIIEITPNGLTSDAPATGVAPGLHHLSFMVDNLNALVMTVNAHGGHADPAGIVATPDGPMLFCTDPDGVRLEIWERTEFPPAD